MLSTTERLALLNAAILAVRPFGHLAEAALEPLQTLRDDMAGDRATPAKARAAKQAVDGPEPDEAAAPDEPAGQ